MAFLVTTTGTYFGDIVFHDLGGKTIAHPTNNLDLSLEFTQDELHSSQDIKNALDNNWIKVSDGFTEVTTSDGLINISAPHSVGSHEDVHISGVSDKDIIAFDQVSGVFKNFTAQDLGLSQVGHTHGFPNTAYYYVSSINQLNTTAQGYALMSGMSVTVQESGMFFVSFSMMFELNEEKKEVGIIINKNGNNIAESERLMCVTKNDVKFSIYTQCNLSLSAGDVVSVYCKTASGTLKIFSRTFSVFRLGA